MLSYIAKTSLRVHNLLENRFLKIIFTLNICHCVCKLPQYIVKILISLLMNCKAIKYENNNYHIKIRIKFSYKITCNIKLQNQL